MATTLAPPSGSGGPSQPRRQRSREPHEHGDGRKHGKWRAPKSPNHVKAKPANPVVISSILDSLDTLALALTSTPPEDHSYQESISEHSHGGGSTSATIRSMQAVSTHSNSGNNHNGARGDLELDTNDEGLDSAAALPPTVRTSRPPSGLSQYVAPRTPSFTGADPFLLASTPPLGSRRSSYSSLDTPRTRPNYARNKLSAESWVKQSAAGQESDAASVDHTATSYVSRRLTSEEVTSQRKAKRIELVPEVEEAAEAPIVSRAEQIIARATGHPLSGSKRRLYLQPSDSTSDEDRLHGTAPAEERSDTPSPLADEGEGSPSKTSARKASIVDSIPMRTTSLRQSLSNSPARGKRKERKSKRLGESAKATSEEDGKEPDNASAVDAVSENKKDSVVDTSSKAIPESSWADLGEEDGTVRRIRQLQEQRKSRFLESQRAASLDGSAVHPATYNTITTPAKVGAIRESIERDISNKTNDLPRPTTGQSSNDPQLKAHKILGIGGRRPTSVSDTQSPQRPRGQIRHLSLDEDLSPGRPLTKDGLPTPPLSLDYSYADAVAALYGAEREMKPQSPVRTIQPPRKAARSISEQLPQIKAQYPGTTVNIVPTVSSPQSKPMLSATRSLRRKHQERWSHHPDLPLEFEKKKNRRKSTSDARNTRYLDLVDTDSVPVPRRNSIDDAVTEYLHNGRLTRRIKHPRTGRVISFSEVGDRNGAAVFVCVGMGLTRYITAFYDELATTLRLRLITIDRPGVGGSEPFPPTERGGPLNWPDDVLIVCQYLDISKFSLVAHSAGAIYALATALVIPQMVHGKVHLLAPWIPPSQLEAVRHSTTSAAPAGALPRSQRILRVLPTTFLKAANSSFMTMTSASLKPANKRSNSRSSPITVPPASRGRERPATRDGTPAQPLDFNRRQSLMFMDQHMPDLNQMENFPIPVTQDSELGESPERQPSLIMSATATPMDPSFEFAATALNAAEHTEKERKMEYTTLLTQRTWELAVRDSNPATDLLVCLERHGDVGFRYTDVAREIVVTHGSEDKRVPLANVKWLAEQMNRRAAVVAQQARDNGMDELAMGRRGCELRVLEGEGHGLMASPSIMGNVLTEVAEYWTR